MMCENHARENERYLIIALLLVAYLAVLYFSWSDSLAIPNIMQTSHHSTHRQGSEHAFLAEQLAIVDDNIQAVSHGTHQEADISGTFGFPFMGFFAHVEQNIRGLGKGAFVISFLVVIFGVFVALLCLGWLAVTFFVCGFIRHVIIPHSLHAPPQVCVTSHQDIERI